MTRGTTPLHVFTLPEDISNYDNFIITYRQNSKTILEKTPADVAIDGKKIKVRLSDTETLLFDSGQKAFVQIRVLKDGNITSSAIFSFPVNSTLNEVHMEDTGIPDYATPQDIIEGKVAYVGGIRMTGEIPIRAVHDSYIYGKSDAVEIQEGYYDSPSTVKIAKREQDKIIPENIVDTTTILGVQGTAHVCDEYDLENKSATVSFGNDMQLSVSQQGGNNSGVAGITGVLGGLKAVNLTTGESTEEVIEEQSSTIAEQESTIAEQSETIAEQESTIAEQETTIAEQAETIEEQQTTITEQSEEILALEETITELKNYGIFIDDEGHIYILVDEEDEDMTIINAILDESAGTVTFEPADIESILQDTDKVRIKAQSELDPDSYCYFYPTLSMLSGKEFFALLYPGVYAVLDITDESTETIPYETHTMGGNIARYEEISEQELINAIENYYENEVQVAYVMSVIYTLLNGGWIDGNSVQEWQAVLNPIISINNHTTIGPVTLINAEVTSENSMNLEMVICGCRVSIAIHTETDAETGDSRAFCDDVEILEYTYNTVVVQE